MSAGAQIALRTLNFALLINFVNICDRGYQIMYPLQHFDRQTFFEQYLDLDQQDERSPKLTPRQTTRSKK